MRTFTEMQFKEFNKQISKKIEKVKTQVEKASKKSVEQDIDIQNKVSKLIN